MIRTLFTLGLSFSLSLFSLAAKTIPVYLGTATDKGIFVADFDPNTGALTGLKNAVSASSPGALAMTFDRKYLFAVGRIKGQKEGIVASYARMKDNTLRPVNQQSSMGAGPCHISLDPTSSTLLVANYSSGSVASYQLDRSFKPGTIAQASSHHQHEGKSVHPKRQTRPHAHSIYCSPDGKFVYAADLGTDRVFIYKHNVSKGAIVPAGEARVPAGSGPRHMAFSIDAADGGKLYVLNELTLTISEFDRDAESGALKLVRTKPVLTGDTEHMTCSEIQLSADGKFIYAACRDLKKNGRDSIAVLKSDTLEIVQNQPTGASIPRHFRISPSGKWLLVAGKLENKVVVIARDPESGKLSGTEQFIDIEAPMWILFP